MSAMGGKRTLACRSDSLEVDVVDPDRGYAVTTEIQNHATVQIVGIVEAQVRLLEHGRDEFRPLVKVRFSRAVITPAAG